MTKKTGQVRVHITPKINVQTFSETLILGTEPQTQHDDNIDIVTGTKDIAAQNESLQMVSYSSVGLFKEKLN